LSPYWGILGSVGKSHGRIDISGDIGFDIPSNRFDIPSNRLGVCSARFSQSSVGFVSRNAVEYFAFIS